MVKRPWLSKTVWMNLIMAVLAFIPEVHAVISTNPETTLAAVNLLNIVLRLITKDQISLVDEKPA